MAYWATAIDEQELEFRGLHLVFNLEPSALNKIIEKESERLKSAVWKDHSLSEVVIDVYLRLRDIEQAAKAKVAVPDQTGASQNLAGTEQQPETNEESGKSVQP